MFCIIRSAKTSCASFEECYTILFRVFCALRNWNFYVTTFITSSVTLPKRKAAILKFGPPAISASREVIIARFNAILDKSERTHLYNDWSNNSRGCYSGSVTWILTRFQMMEVGVTLSINLPFRNENIYSCCRLLSFKTEVRCLPLKCVFVDGILLLYCTRWFIMARRPTNNSENLTWKRLTAVFSSVTHSPSAGQEAIWFAQRDLLWGESLKVDQMMPKRILTHRSKTKEVCLESPCIVRGVGFLFRAILYMTWLKKTLTRVLLKRVVR